MVFISERSGFVSHCLRCDLGDLRGIVDCLKEIYALKDNSSIFKKLKRDNSCFSFATSKNNGGFFELCLDG